MGALHPFFTEFAKLADYAFGDPLFRGNPLQEVLLEDAIRKEHQKEAAQDLENLVDMPKTREVTSRAEVVAHYGKVFALVEVPKKSVGKPASNLRGAQSKVSSNTTTRKAMKVTVMRRPSGSAKQTK